MNDQSVEDTAGGGGYPTGVWFAFWQHRETVLRTGYPSKKKEKRSKTDRLTRENCGITGKFTKL